MTEQQVRNAFGKDVRIAEFKKVDESGKKAVASFGMHYYQLITAGKPCLIKPSQVNDTYTIQGVTIDAEKALTIDDPNKKFDFVGTYETTPMPVNSHFLGSNDGKLYYITTAKNIRGLKAFLKPTENNSGAKLSIAFGSTDYDWTTIRLASRPSRTIPNKMQPTVLPTRTSTISTDSSWVPTLLFSLKEFT